MTTVGNKIIVKPFPPKEVSSNGIFIPATAQWRSSKATIVAAGIKSDYVPGMVVFHVKDAGVEISHDGIKLYVMEDRDVLAHLEN